jgi:putative PIN family toxin of toxin-antitoxin system
MSKSFAVVDTSVVIGFYLGRKSVAHAAFLSLRHRHHLLASQDTLQEFSDVLLRKKFERIPRDLRLAFIAEYERTVILIEPHVQITACIDPKDDKFLSLAVSGNASLILTSDDHLLRLNPFRGIAILKPTEYLERTVQAPERPLR